ncbi:cache domain-containing protein [Pinibacter aurantiacus]|uniref:Cache domain-containing protein n=1 Tax=Pinibacter aurantiacus TaxID=2851599 RepID=A0A9E2W6Z0_9BACT|nr:cache domain-containing protein [Pinibacter aurantiacus]MBV4360393.1 cache domain-containing protein [Pinibacter aurantiacus]
MKQTLSKTKRQIPLFVFLCIFALLALMYYFVYIPGNERRLDAEHFKWLQNIDENIRKKIGEADTLLVGYMKMFECDKLKGKTKIWQQKGDNGTIVGRVVSNHEVALNKGVYDKNKYQLDTLFNKDQFSIDADSAIKKISFTLCRNNVCVTIRYDFSDFVSPLLPSAIFDHYVIFYKGGYIYEDFHSGLSYKIEDSLLSDNKSKTIASSTIIQQKIGGEEFKMFLQPIIFGDKKLIIAGLHSSARFDSEKKAIPEGLVSMAVIIAFAMFLIIPWLRILFMGKYDRLQLKNIFWVSLVTKVLMSIFFLMFFGFQSPSTDAGVEQSARFIDSTVSANFTAGVGKASKLLDSFIAIKNDTPFKYYKHIINLGKNSAQHDVGTANCPYIPKFENISDSAKDRINSIEGSLKARDVNWLSKEGDVLNNWTNKPSNTIHANYKDRRYFREVINDINLIGSDSTLFSLDQVISRTNGDFCTVISKRTKDGGVVAMAFDLACMNKMILPLGYSVMIVDSSGLVRYHSKSDKNLNENIFEELSNLSDDGLKSSLKGRFKFHCKATYFEKNYDVWMTPLKGYRYSILVMRNRTYIDSRDVQTFSFSMSMIFWFLIITLVDLAVMIFTSARRSPFKKQFFVTSWLWPRRSSEKEYIHATIYFTIVLVTLLCIYLFDATSFIYFLLILILTLPLLTLFLNILFWEKYTTQQTNYKRFKRRCTIGLIILIAIYLIAAIAILKTEVWRIFLYILFLTLVWLVQRYFRSTKLKTNKQNNEASLENGSDRYIAWYTIMLFTRMIITSGIPAMFFYTSSFNYEQNLMARFKQVSMVQQFAKSHLTPDEITSAPNVYRDNADISKFNTSGSNHEDTLLERTDVIAAKIFNSCGRLFGNLTFENDDFYQTNADDGSLSYNNILRKHVASTTFIPLSSKPNTYWSIDADPEKILYQSPGLRHDGWIFWTIFLVMLSSFFFALLFIIKKVFGKDVLYMAAVDLFDRKLEEEQVAKKKMIIVALVDEYKKHIEKLNSEQERKENAPYYFDFKVLCKSEKDEDFYKAFKSHELDLKTKNLSSPLYVTNFEDGFSDLLLVKRKVFFLDKILQFERSIIILTSKHPIIIATEMRGMIDSKDAPVKDILRDRMDALLGKFTTVVHPLEPIKDADINDKDDVKRHIACETQFTFFLNELGKTISVDPTNHPYRLSDAITLKIQAIAHNFYKVLWNTLTENEKFVLYDLAEDGLVNTTNKFSLNLLISRGIIIREDGGLHIFNRSFRNFVVTAIGKEELEKINHKHAQNSRWGKLNGLLIFCGIAVLIFLGVTQNLVYTKAIGALTGLGTAVVAIVNILNSVGSKTGKGKSDAA